MNPPIGVITRVSRAFRPRSCLAAGKTLCFPCQESSDRVLGRTFSRGIRQRAFTGHPARRRSLFGFGLAESFRQQTDIKPVNRPVSLVNQLFSVNRLFLAVMLVIPALFMTACASTSGSAMDGSSGEREYVYITNQGDATINVIDVATNTVAEVVDLTQLGFDPGAKPHHVAVEPDGSHWYVSLISAGRVLKFTRDNELVGSAEFEVPGLLELDPASHYLFVGRSMAAVNPPQRIGMIDTNTMETEELEVFIPRPHALAVAPNGKYVYSASLAENRMTVINIETGDTEFHDLDGPTHTLVDLQISPDGTKMISGGQLTGKFFFFDATDQAGVPVEKVIDVEAAPWHPVFNREGTRAYFANKMADKVTILNMETEEVEAVISGNGLAQPHGTALSADGKYLYVSNQNMNMAYTAADGSHPGTVVVIDTEKAEIIKVLEVGSMPAGAAGRPTF